jgi:hypothetical protein
MSRLWRVVAVLLTVALLTSPACADDAERLEALFAPGRALSLQLVFDRDAADEDWCMNSSVGEVTSEAAPDGRRALVITTAAWVVNDAEHAFRCRLVDGRLASIELLVAGAPGEWRRAPPIVFAFEPVRDGARPAETDEAGEVALALRGSVNRGRGREQRGPALVVLRSSRVAGAPDLSY